MKNLLFIFSLFIVLSGCATTPSHKVTRFEYPSILVTKKYSQVIDSAAAIELVQTESSSRFSILLGIRNKSKTPIKFNHFADSLSIELRDGSKMEVTLSPGNDRPYETKTVNPTGKFNARINIEDKDIVNMISQAAKIHWNISNKFSKIELTFTDPLQIARSKDENSQPQ